MEIDNLMDKYEKILKERSSQKVFCSEHHRLLDTKYIVYHQEFVEFKGSNQFKRMGEKDREYQVSKWKETPKICKNELDNYENNRSIDEDLHKALDGLYSSEKLNPRYAFILKYNLTSNWKDPGYLESAREAYQDRNKYC